MQKIELPSTLTQYIWTFIDDNFAKQFIRNSKNFRKSLNLNQLNWNRLGTYISEIAASRGHLDIIIFCYDNNLPWDEKTPEAAARNGHLDILKYVRSVDPPCPWNKKTPEAAARNGHLDILKYVRSVDPPCPWDATAIIIAALNRHSDILEWARSTELPIRIFSNGRDQQNYPLH